MAQILLGKVVGDPGAKGEKGDQGIQGVQGVQGVPGANGSDATVVIANDLLQTVAGKALDATQGKVINDALVAHKAESVSKTILVIEPYNQTTQTTIELGFRPKMIIIDAIIKQTVYRSIAYMGEDGNYTTRYVRKIDGTFDLITSSVVYFYESTSARISATVNITDTGLLLNWTVTGLPTGASGERRLIVTAMTHGGM